MRHILVICVLLVTIAAGASLVVAREAPLRVSAPVTAGSTVQAWSTPENLANTSADSRVPQLAVTASGTAHVVWEEDGSIYHTFGSSGAWSTPAETVLGDSPSLALGTGDDVHLAYVSESGDTFDIFYTRWNGSGWTLPVNVSHTTGVSTAPAIAFAPGGTLHVVWADNTGGSVALYHGQSSDGNTWSTFPVPNGAGSGPAVAAGADDILHVAWQSADPTTGRSDIWYMRLSGGSWSLPENISATPDEDSTVPAIALAPDGTVHIVWQEGLDSNTAIYHVSGRPGSWSQAGDVSGTLQSAGFPALSMDSAANGFLVWDEGSVIVGRGLDAATGTWSAREEVSSSAGGIADPTVFVGDNAAHAVWAQKISESNWDIFYGRRTGGEPPLSRKVYLPLISRK